MRFLIGMFAVSGIVLAAFSHFYSAPIYMTSHPHVYPFDPLAEPRAGRGGVSR